MVEDDKHTRVYGKEMIFFASVLLFVKVQVSFYSRLSVYLEFRAKENTLSVVRHGGSFRVK